MMGSPTLPTMVRYPSVVVHPLSILNGLISWFALDVRDNP